MVWEAIAVLSTLCSAACLLYAVGAGAWWAWVFPCLWASFCLIDYDWLCRACFALLLPIYFQRTAWLVPALLYAFWRAGGPPFDRFAAVFTAAARAAAAAAALAAVHGAVSAEHDLMLAPILVFFVAFSAAWAMWARFDRTNVSYVVLAAVAVHTAQAAAMCLAPGAPPWALWGGPAIFYVVLSAAFWIIVGVHWSRTHSVEQALARLA